MSGVVSLNDCAGIGIVAGLIASSLTASLLASVLYGVRPHGPAVFLIVPVILLAVAVLASYLPAHRATKVNPMSSIRSGYSGTLRRAPPDTRISSLQRRVALAYSGAHAPPFRPSVRRAYLVLCLLILHQGLAVPIVVKLSHAFYERFGDDVVSELVGVLNQVDAVSQQSLRDLNDANWSRFEDRLTRGLAEVRSEIHGDIAALDGRFTAMLHTEIGRLDARLSAQLVAQMRWMIGIWGAMLLAVMGLWFKR